MALTATCKKCCREVAPGDLCPVCGTKLAKNAAHAAWVTERRPVSDWMCWNAVMRWLLPAGLFILILVLGLEALSGGAAAVERLFRGEFPAALLILLGVLTAAVLLALALQGKELVDYVVDSRGVHATRWLPEPTALKLLLRLKSPALLKNADPEADPPVLRLDEQNLSWRNVARVQVWPEKCYILFYAPSWWLRIPVRCTPFSWEDALSFVREKLGKKKAVRLPEHLRVSSAAGKAAARGASRPAPAPVYPEESFSAEPPEEDRHPDSSGAEPGPAPDGVPPSAGEQMTLDLDPRD